MMGKDMSKLSVGVVIPAYNAQQWIVAALDSVARQTRLPDAVVVVNDGSQDNTVEVVREWIGQAPAQLKVHLLSQSNHGIAGARNAAVRELDTDLVALLDADDIWEPHHLARTCEAMERNDDLVLCFANHQPFDQDGPVGSPFLQGKNIETLPKEEREGGLTVLRGGVLESLLPGCYIPPTTSVLRKAAVDTIGWFDTEFRVAEDYDFFIRLSRVGTYGYYDDIHAHYRLHGDNASHESRSLRMKAFGLVARSKLLRQAQRLEFTDTERRFLRQVTDAKCRELLYNASQHGVRTYVTYAWRCVNAGVWLPVLRPKDWLRSLAVALGYSERGTRSTLG